MENKKVIDTKSEQIIEKIHMVLNEVDSKLKFVTISRLEENDNTTQFEGPLVESLKSLLKRISNIEESISI